MGESENGKSSEQRAREKARNFVANESVSIALKKVPVPFIFLRCPAPTTISPSMEHDTTNRSGNL